MPTQSFGPQPKTPEARNLGSSEAAKVTLRMLPSPDKYIRCSGYDAPVSKFTAAGKTRVNCGQQDDKEKGTTTCFARHFPNAVLGGQAAMTRPWCRAPDASARDSTALELVPLRQKPVGPFYFMVRPYGRNLDAFVHIRIPNSGHRGRQRARMRYASRDIRACDSYFFCVASFSCRTNTANHKDSLLKNNKCLMTCRCVIADN